MGSRGQALKTGGFIRHDYHTIMRDGNIRFVVQNDTIKATKVPEVSNSPNVVYATFNERGILKAISFYNSRRVKYKEIDFKTHNGMNPHVHTLNPKTGLRNDKLAEVRKPNLKEQDYIDKVQSFCKKHNLNEKTNRIGKENE